MKETFYKLSPTMQVIVIVLGIILLWFLLRSARGFLQRAGQVSEVIGEVASLQAQGVSKSYTNNQYNSYADRLYYAMKGLGTDEEEIGRVFSDMQNDLDVIALTNAFGVRDGYTLQAWLRGDLGSAAEMNRYVNDILRMKGITKTF